MADGCISAARVTAQNILFTLRLYPVYNSSVFDYLRVVVYSLYNSIKSTTWRVRSVQLYILHRCRNDITKN